MAGTLTIAPDASRTHVVSRSISEVRITLISRKYRPNPSTRKITTASHDTCVSVENSADTT